MKRPMILASCLVLASVLGCAGSGERQRAIYILEESGDFAYASGDYDLAVTEYSEVVERRPGKRSARVELGRALIAAGQPDLAVEHLDAAYTIKPDDQEVIELLAQAMLESGNTERLTAFLRERTSDRDTTESWLRLGRYLRLAGDADEAERALLEAASLDGGQSLAPQLELARFYNSIGDSEKALRRYRMVLYVDPRNEIASDYLRSVGEVPGPTFALEPDER